MECASVRVLHVFGALDRGGAELRTLEQMGVLSSRGVRADFLALSGRPGALADRPTRWGGEVIPMRLSMTWPWNLYRLLRRREYDVVHSHVATFSGAILLISKMAGVPVRIAHFRSDGDAHGRSPRRMLQRWVMRRLIDRCATHVLGVSPGALHGGYSARWADDPRSAVIPNGLPASGEAQVALKTAEDLPLRIINVGRPLSTKRRGMVGDVAAAVAARGRAVELIMVGEIGEDIQELPQKVANGVVVKLVGVRDDVRRQLARSDVLVFPSVREGLPGVVLEALFEGTPVVAGDLPGTSFIVQEIPDAPLWRLPESATVDEWADAVTALVDAAPPREVTRRLMEQSAFSLERSASALAGIYGLQGAEAT